MFFFMADTHFGQLIYVNAFLKISRKWIALEGIQRR